MFRNVEYFHAMAEITNPHLSYILSVLGGEISNINFSIRNNLKNFNISEEHKNFTRNDNNLKAEIADLKNEISQIKKALELLGVEYKNGVFIVKEQTKKKFLDLF